MSVLGKIPDAQNPWEHLKSAYCESGAETTPRVVLLFSDLESAQKIHQWAITHMAQRRSKYTGQAGYKSAVCTVCGRQFQDHSEEDLSCPDSPVDGGAES